MLTSQNSSDLDYKSRDNFHTLFVGRVAERTAIAKMQPLLSEYRAKVKDKIPRQSLGEFFMFRSGTVTEVKAERGLMTAEQLAEDEICALARSRS